MTAAGIVALSGWAGCGKDTVGARLVQHGYVRASFAEPIREALYALNPLANVHPGNGVRFLVDVHGWDGAKQLYPEIRRLLQHLGTEMGRELFGDNFWVDRAFAAMPDGARVVLTDCRFVNEAEAVKAAGGQVWRIQRPGTAPVNAHASETSLDDYPFDAVLYNDGTVEALHEDVDYWLAAEAWGHR